MSLSLLISDKCIKSCLQNNTNESMVVHFDEWNDLKQHLTNLKFKNKELTNEQVQIQFYTNNAVIYPLEIPNNEALKLYSYFTFNTDSEAKENWLVNYNEVNGGRIIYAVNNDMQNYVVTIFPNSEYQSHVKGLMSLYNKIDYKQFALLHLFNNSFDVLMSNDGKLLMYNNFTFRTKEDFIYYLLFAIEKSGLNILDTNVVICGDISVDSALWLLLKRYITKIELLESDINTNIYKLLRCV